MKTKQLFAVGMAALMLMGCGSSAGRIRFGAAGLGGKHHQMPDTFRPVLLHPIRCSRTGRNVSGIW